MLKISESARGKRSITLKLEGRVVELWVAELRNVCDLILSEGTRLELELADVSYLDNDGVAVLNSLRSRGVKLLNCSPFVDEQLKTPEP